MDELKDYEYMQVGVTAMRGPNGFLPAVPIYIRVPRGTARKVDANTAADAAGLFAKPYREATEARFKAMTGEDATLPEELQ